MASKRAGPAQPSRKGTAVAVIRRAAAPKKRFKEALAAGGERKTIPEQLEEQGWDLDTPKEIFEACARLYGRGLSRSQIARALVDHLVPANTRARTHEQKLHGARRKLRDWENRKDFRDLIYANAVKGLDLELPGILQGVGRVAKKGRVDAARLALEVTNRHTKDDQPPTQVTVNIANIPRPEG